MHPLVWATAATVWDTGQYRVAVQQATVALSAHVKAQVESHLNDRELVAQVFAADPPGPDRFVSTSPATTKTRRGNRVSRGFT